MVYEQLLTPPEAATYLHVAVQTLAKWRWLNTGPRYHKVGKQLVRYAQADLDAWLAGQAQDPLPAPASLPVGASLGRLVLTLPPQRRKARHG